MRSSILLVMLASFDAMRSADLHPKISSDLLTVKRRALPSTMTETFTRGWYGYETPSLAAVVKRSAQRRRSRQTHRHKRGNRM